MTLNLTVSSPPQSFTEPLTVAEVEHYLSLPSLSPDDENRTALLESLISAAREVAELHQGRDLVQKQFDLTMESFPATISLRPHLVTVDLVQYTDSDGTVTALTENTDYIVDTAKQPGVIMPVYGESWPTFTPWPSSPILVRFTAGLAATDAFWADAGKRIVVGMKMLIKHWYESPEAISKPGSTGAEIPFGISVLLGSGAIPRAR